MIKTFVPGAVFIVGRAHRYLTRYQGKLEANLSTEQAVCLLNAITALGAFLACIFKPADTP